MAIHHAPSGEPINIRPLGNGISSARAATPYKTQHLVFRMVMLAGKEVPEHHVIGELMVQCLEGRLELYVGDKRDVMRPGDFKCLTGGTPHSFKAIEDSSVLFTLLKAVH